MNIYQAINAVMKDCGAVGKDTQNQQQGYQYRGIDAVMNALNPALTKNKVFVAPEVLEQVREERVNSKGTLLIYSIVKAKYTFFAEDGSYISAVVIGEGMDTGDKATNKAMSAAFKYALFQTFCIPTEEMVDSEKDSPEPMPKEKPQANAKTSQDVRKNNEEIYNLVAQIIDKGIDPAYVCRLFKAKTIADLTDDERDYVSHNMDKLLAKYTEDNEKGQKK